MNKSKKEEKKAYVKGRKAGKSQEEIMQDIEVVMITNRLMGNKINPARRNNRLKGWQEEEKRKPN